jgi:hypothetical protein
MPLTNVRIAPGINKADTPSGAEGQWIDGDFVRFRYGQPEKIGGYTAIGQETIAGPTRAQHTWTDLEGRRYAALGTSKCLYIYYEDAFYDVTPLDTQPGTASFTSTTGSSTVTVTLTSHTLLDKEYVTFSSVTLPGGGVTGYSASDFTNTTFEITNITTNTFDIIMPSNETGTGMSTAGTATVEAYVEIGPTIQTYGYGWGTGTWSGNVSGAQTTTLNGALLNDTNGTGGSGTSITLTSATGFSGTGGKILVDQEIITYTGVSSNDLTGITRGAQGTSTAAHSNGATVTEITNFIGWGDQTTTSSLILDPGSWSLDNFGEQLIATIKDGKTFTWNPGVSNPLTVRATIMVGAPTASRLTITSDRDRHVVHFGTETTIGDNTTQDPMFIRFSDQENYNVYQPTSVNTAGTFRLDTGNKIVAAVSGKDYNLILTDQAAYTMQFVGPPFTFSIRQVGSNCGCIGQHATVYADGKVFWMGSGGGFFVFDGTVKLLPSLVEDFVFTTTGSNVGINYSSNEIIYGSHNSLFNEITWFYPSGTPLGEPAIQNNRSVVYNYVENTWSTMTLARSSYSDASTYDVPYATAYNSTAIPTISNISGATDTFGASTYFAQEVGNNEISLDGTETAILAYIQSGDFDLPTDGDGEYLLRLSRFLPDFKNLQGKAIVTIFLKNFPIDSGTSSQLGPFIVDANTQKIDTRARGRLANIKIQNEGNKDNNETWRFGTFRADVNPDGRR